MTPTYKKIKKNGTTLYVFPGVQEDKNFETQNENYRMYISHFAFVKFPRQMEDNTNNVPVKLDFANTFAVNNYNTNNFADQLIESLRNYVANHEITIRNSMVNSTDMYYDVFENNTVTEKVFWKWAKKLGIIDFELADNNDYFMNDTKYDHLGTSGSIEHQRELLWKERTNELYSGTLSIISAGILEIELTVNSKLVVGDYILINVPNLEVGTTPVHYSSTHSLLKVTGISSSGTLINNVITVAGDDTVASGVVNVDICNAYERFIKFMSEIQGVNNVQLADKTYTEAFAYISHQQGETPYILFKTAVDNNYKPNSSFPILPTQVQAEIVGGENPNNPILTHSSLYPGNIWAQFDNGLKYETSSGDINKRVGDYYGNFNSDNNNVSLYYPNIKADKIDGLCIDFDINNYAKAANYIFPVETFKEFSSIHFDQMSPKDFDFNAVLWFYTIEDVTGNNVEYATNLYGIEFINSPDNDIDSTKTFIPTEKKIVTNGYQDGNSYTFSLDTNIYIESYNEPNAFDPDKIYSLFGMELYYEALTRMTYMNDKLGQILSNNSSLKNEINALRSAIFTEENYNSIKQKIVNIEQLLNVYSILQIGNSDTIIPELDTSVNPALIRLKSIDKKYGRVLQYYTKDMFSEFQNSSAFTQINALTKVIPIDDGKDFLVVINNNDNNIPSPAYDTTIMQDKLEIVIDKDLQFKQTLDILLLPQKSNTGVTLGSNTNYEPINDKKLNLYIKYNDGQISDNVLIKTLSLPVSSYVDGTSFYEDNAKKFENSPKFDVKHVYFSNNYSSNVNKRAFKFIIDGDLTKNPQLLKNSRILINNFMPLISTSSTQYIDLSDQYALSENASIRTLKVTDMKLINSSSSIYTYTANTQANIYDVNNNIVGICQILTVNGTGQIERYYAQLFETVDHPTTSTTPDVSYGDVIYRVEYSSSVGDPNSARIMATEKVISELTIEHDTINNTQEIVSMLSDYTNKLASSYGSEPLIKEMCIDQYLKVKPEITFLKGTLISITRISDKVVVPVNDISDRYNIKISTL